MASGIEQIQGIIKLGKGLSAGQVYQGMSCEDLVFKNIIANNVGTSQILTITQNSQSLYLTTNLSTPKTGIEDIYYVEDLTQLQLLTNQSTTFGLQIGDLAWVQSESAYYRWNGSSFVLFAPDTQFGTPGGSESAIQFHTGSVGTTPGGFSGSGNFTYDYSNNRARLTGSLIVSGSTILTGSFNVHNSFNGGFFPTFENRTNGSNTETGFVVAGGSGVSGSLVYIAAAPKGYTANPTYAGSSIFITAPTDITGDVNRPVKQIFAILGTPATNNAFEWHYSSSYILGGSSPLKMKLDVPSGTLSVSGSIITSGSLTIASGSANNRNDTALYFGNSGSNGSWRFSLTNGTMSLQAHNGSGYQTKQEWT